MLYSIRLYNDITTSMSSAWSICVLFVSLMQSANRAKFLNFTYLSVLFGFAGGGGTGAIDIVLLASIYASP